MKRKNKSIPKAPEIPKLPRLTRDFVINQFDITDPYWSHITADQARKIASKMLQYAETNVRQIEKANLFSPSYEVYKNSGGKLQPLPADASRSKAILELARLQQFLGSQTSTAKGIREVNRQQDIRIFGVNPKTGNPKHKMTIKERKAFWAAYNEFMRGETTRLYTNYTSNVIQQALFSVGLHRKKFTSSDFNRIIPRLPLIQKWYEENPDLGALRRKISSFNWKEYDMSNGVFKDEEEERKYKSRKKSKNIYTRTAEDIEDEVAAVRTGRRNRRKK